MHDKLNTLSGNTSATTEKGIYKYTNSSVIQNASVSAQGHVQFPAVPNLAQCTMMAHTHNSPANSTYSIFSWQDLEGMAKFIRNGQANVDNYVEFLATADGTYYAITVEDPVKFAQFFANSYDAGYDPAIGLIRANEMRIYYGSMGNSNPLIKEDSSNLDSEKAFLQLLQNNNLGATLLQTDSTFTTFTKVKYNKATDNIIPTPCN